MRWRRRILSLAGFAAVLAVVGGAIRDLADATPLSAADTRLVSCLLIGTALVICLSLWRRRTSVAGRGPLLADGALPAISTPRTILLPNQEAGFLWLPGGNIYYVAPKAAPLLLVGKPRSEAVAYIKLVLAQEESFPLDNS